MKYIKLFENFDSYDPYDLMIMSPNEKALLIINEIKKINPNFNLINDLIALGANLDWQDETDDNLPLLFLPLRFKSIEITKILLESGANPNLQNDYGTSPLHYSSATNLFGAAKILIEYNANPNILNKNKKTPLHLASYFNNFNIVRLLLESGADPNLKDIDNKTPLDLIGEVPKDSIFLNKNYNIQDTVELIKEYIEK
jgi:ankyrin repeat protein